VVSKILALNWALWFFWIMATTVGWFLGGLIFSNLAFITSGFAVGIFQWLVLQGHIAHPWRWVVATIAGWTAGYFAVFFGIPQEFATLHGLVMGLTTGLAQWIVLRHELNWSGWWIVFSGIGWTTGLTLFPGVMLTGTLVGVLTGLPLIVLLRVPTRLPRRI
jgi:hypothetical protein